jgi:hypothetical protein
MQPRERFVLGWRLAIMAGLLAWWVAARLLDEEAERSKRPAVGEDGEEGELRASADDDGLDADEDEDGLSKKRLETVWNQTEEDFR